MQSVGDGSLVRTNTTDLTSILRVCRSTLDEGRANETNRMVSAGKNKVSDDLFVSVHDEVTTPR